MRDSERKHCYSYGGSIFVSHTPKRQQGKAGRCMKARCKRIGMVDGGVRVEYIRRITGYLGGTTDR